MARPKSPEGEPTRAELDILQVLWEKGACTVREVNDQLNQKRDTAYTTTLKIMQLMYEKGLLLRDDSQMTHVYFAAIKENVTKTAMLKRFVDTVFKGSESALMVQLLGNKKPNKDELALIKDLINRIEKK